MAEIGIRSWGMIPMDREPATGCPVQMRPPMFVAMALDRSASLVFSFRQAPGRLRLSLEATALTAEGRGPRLFSLHTGHRMDSYQALPPCTSESCTEGMYTVFRTEVDGVLEFLKVCFTESRPIVINRVEFVQP